MSPKFKEGDWILHPDSGKRYIVRYVGRDEYRLGSGHFDYVYLQFLHEGGFRLCDEQTVDRILTKYSNEVDSVS